MALTALSTQSAGGTASAAGWANVVKANFDVLIAAWTAYVPTVTGITVGNGTLAAAYIQVGKMVHFRISLQLGSTSAVASSGNIFTMPVVSIAGVNQAAHATCYDSSASSISAAAVGIGLGGVGNMTVGITNTAPFTWATSDQLLIAGVYEAA